MKTLPRERALRRLARALAAGALAAILAPAGVAQDEVELPGYYQWYQRTGELSTLRPEAERDAQMADGSLTAESLSVAAPDVVLKTPDGADWRLADHLSSGYTVLIPFQSWW